MAHKVRVLKWTRAVIVGRRSKQRLAWHLMTQI
jgi:hypothetical protein